MLKFTDFLLACGVNLNLADYKIHLATGREYPPLEAFFQGAFKEWQEDQAQQNFECDMVVSLIHLHGDKWLFAGAYRVLGHRSRKGKSVMYSTQLMPGQDDLVGRVVVTHARSGRASYLWGQQDGGPFFLSHIRETRLTVEEFPGYHAVTVSHARLKTIINENIPSWRGALANIKGVYLIADTTNGALYVGSASGNDGIWQRWSGYASTGHGGNVELKAVLRQKGADHATNFQYAILEIADAHSPDAYIRERENYWKRILLTREFGYNDN